MASVQYRPTHGSPAIDGRGLASLPGHGGDHLLPAFVAPFLMLPVEGRRLSLGTWQRVVIVDPNRDNNHRTVILSYLQD